MSDADAPEGVDQDLEDLEDPGFTLRRPIEKLGDTVLEEPITRLDFKSPHAGQLRATDRHKGEAAKAIALIARMAGVPIKAIDALHPYDYRRAQEIAERFFGEASSEDGPRD